MPRKYRKRVVPKIEDKFGRLTIKELFVREDGKTCAKCLCECGQYSYPRATSLVQGRITSCGCWKAEKAAERTKIRNFKFGRGNHSNRLYRIWAAMRNRCNNPNNSWYKYYGGKGIIVCKLWNSYIAFEDWALNNGYAEGLTLDRVNVNDNYKPENCRWATRKVQARNRSNNRIDTVKITAFNETKTLSDWLDDSRCAVKNGTTICYRIGAGWTPEEAISKKSERR
jgi:hypothetical protein